MSKGKNSTKVEDNTTIQDLMLVRKTLLDELEKKDKRIASLEKENKRILKNFAELLDEAVKVKVDNKLATIEKGVKDMIIKYSNPLDESINAYNEALDEVLALFKEVKK